MNQDTKGPYLIKTSHYLSPVGGRRTMGANMDSVGWGRGETEVGITRHQQSLRGHYSKLTVNQLGKGGGSHNNSTEHHRESGKICHDTTKILRLPTPPSPPPQGINNDWSISKICKPSPDRFISRGMCHISFRLHQKCIFSWLRCSVKFQLNNFISSRQPPSFTL